MIELDFTQEDLGVMLSALVVRMEMSEREVRRCEALTNIVGADCDAMYWQGENESARELFNRLADDYQTLVTP